MAGKRWIWLGLSAVLMTEAVTFALTPGSVVALEGGPNVIRAYDFAGNLLDSLPLTTPFAHPSGLTIIGQSVYVLSGQGTVGRVDLQTGAIINLISVQGGVALGDTGTNLLVADLTTGAVSEYTTAGLPVGQFATTGLITGLDGDASCFFAGTYSSGQVHRYNFEGKLLNTINTGVGAGSISGIGFDPDTQTLWVASGFGDGRIRQFTMTGRVVRQFVQGQFVMGLDIVRRKRS